MKINDYGKLTIEIKDLKEKLSEPLHNININKTVEELQKWELLKVEDSQVMLKVKGILSYDAIINNLNTRSLNFAMPPIFFGEDSPYIGLSIGAKLFYVFASKYLSIVSIFDLSLGALGLFFRLQSMGDSGIALSKIYSINKINSKNDMDRFIQELASNNLIKVEYNRIYLNTEDE